MYKNYTALISQVGTNTPDIVVLENSLGNIVWTRESAGRYIATLANTFTIGKTYCPPFDRKGYTVMPIWANAAYDFGYQVTEDITIAPDALAMNVYDKDYNSVDISSIAENLELFIEIRVYK